jgi:hypothetical protein
MVNFLMALCVFFVVGKLSLFLVGVMLRVMQYAILVLRDFLMVGCVGIFLMVIFRIVF